MGTIKRIICILIIGALGIYFISTSDFYQVLDPRTLARRVLSKEFIEHQYRDLITQNSMEQVDEWIDMSESQDFSYYGDNTCPPNKYRWKLKKILRRWDNIAKKNNITYSLTCGTLLGAWRTGDLVPLDADLDVLISAKDNWKLDRIKEKNLNFNNHDGKYHLYLQRDWQQPYEGRGRYLCNGQKTTNYKDQCSFIEPLGRLMRFGTHVDIYDYTVRDGLLIDPSEGYHELKIEDIFPLKKCMFLDMEMKCSNKPKVHLESFYSNLKPNKICVNGSWVKMNDA